jgi:hypothetical protein
MKRLTFEDALKNAMMIAELLMMPNAPMMQR